MTMLMYTVLKSEIFRQISVKLLPKTRRCTIVET